MITPLRDINALRLRKLCNYSLQATHVRHSATS
jgi:hypothetical protein